MRQIKADSRHPIQVVSNRTGLSADVIRAWERRYDAVRPSRSGTRRRLYSDEDVERLLLLHRVTRSGRRIGDVAGLTLDELAALVDEDRRAGADRPATSKGRDLAAEAERHLHRALEAVRSLDPRTLAGQLERATTELDLETALEGVLTPLLQRVGDAWLRGTLSIVHEHMTTSVVRSLLDSLLPSVGAPTSAPRLIATTPGGQYHELGALMTTVVAAVEGWRAVYLGSDLPADEIASAADGLDARVVALSIVYPDADGTLAPQLRRLGKRLGPRTSLVVGGRAASDHRALLDAIGARLCPDFQSFRSELRRLAGASEAFARPASGE